MGRNSWRRKQTGRGREAEAGSPRGGALSVDVTQSGAATQGPAVTVCLAGPSLVAKRQSQAPCTEPHRLPGSHRPNDCMFPFFLCLRPGNRMCLFPVDPYQLAQPSTREDSQCKWPVGATATAPYARAQPSSETPTGGKRAETTTGAPTTQSRD